MRKGRVLKKVKHTAKKAVKLGFLLYVGSLVFVASCFADSRTRYD